MSNAASSPFFIPTFDHLNCDRGDIRILNMQHLTQHTMAKSHSTSMIIPHIRISETAGLTFPNPQGKVSGTCPGSLVLQNLGPPRMEPSHSTVTESPRLTRRLPGAAGDRTSFLKPLGNEEPMIMTARA